MGHELRIRIKTLVMILAMVVCANVGDLMLKRGMTQIGAVEISPAGLQHALLSTISNGTIWMGIFFSDRVHAQLYDGAELGGLQLRNARGSVRLCAVDAARSGVF